MSIFTHCTLFLTLAALLLSGFCIGSAPAAASPCPLSFCIPPCSLPPDPCSTRSCSSSLFPPLSASPPPPNFTCNPIDTTFPLFRQSCLRLQTNLCSSSPFTINFTDKQLLDSPPILAFFLFQSHWTFMELTFDFSIRDSCAAAEQQPLLVVCNSSQEPQNLTFESSCKKPSSGFSDQEEPLFNYSVSLAYNANSTILDVQAKVSYGSGLEINQTFILNITDLLQDVHDGYRGQYDNIHVFVAYITQGNATINISTINDAPSESPIYGQPVYSLSPPPPPPTQNKSKSTHFKVVVGVVAGVSIVALLVVLTILALTIKKRYRGRPPLVRSHLASRNHVDPPSTKTRAPLPHPHLESSATPMMTTLCPSPPYQTDNFQLSSTASWLKQPNPR